VGAKRQAQISLFSLGGWVWEYCVRRVGGTNAIIPSYLSENPPPEKNKGKEKKAPELVPPPKYFTS